MIIASIYKIVYFSHRGQQSLQSRGWVTPSTVSGLRIWLKERVTEYERTGEKSAPILYLAGHMRDCHNGFPPRETFLILGDEDGDHEGLWNERRQINQSGSWGAVEVKYPCS